MDKSVLAFIILSIAILGAAWFVRIGMDIIEEVFFNGEDL